MIGTLVTAQPCGMETPGDLEEFLDILGSPISNQQGYNGMDCGCDQAEHQVAASHQIDKRASEGVVPVVPHVHIQRLGPARSEHDQVDAQGNDEDQRAHCGAKGDGSRHTPTDVQSIELDACSFDQGSRGRAQCIKKQGDDETKADEAHAHGEG